MASRRSRPTGAAEQLIGKPHHELPAVGVRQYRLLDGLRDWHITLLPPGGAPVEVAMHANVLDGAWNGRDAIFWILRPRRRRPAD